MTLGLGLDAGGTATRWALAGPEGGVVAAGAAPALSGLLFSDAARAQARAAIEVVAEAVRPHGVPAALLAGVTGLGEDTAEAKALAGMLAAAFGLPPARVRLADDMWIAHQARFAPGEGVLVYAGTGSAAVHVDRAGCAVRVGGLGHLIDDAGSGYAIGRDALRAVLRAEDAEPGSGWGWALGRAVARTLGGASWATARRYAYGGDRGSMAALAPAVAEAAQAGDPVALGVLQQAGRDLAALARVLLRRVGAQPVALAGGAARLHAAVPQAMRDALGEPVSTGEIDPAAAAARVAAQYSRAPE
ncbi:MAG TPA: BadF/BadG/BcrA/BcrD ATPase family protein [Acetobacteraceae bacterium]|nr:BadF/BadG/BcrA/BcrD ATPase family protein [Acetobacteraceae bacterium]